MVTVTTEYLDEHGHIAAVIENGIVHGDPRYVPKPYGEGLGKARAYGDGRGKSKTNFDEWPEGEKEAFMEEYAKKHVDACKDGKGHEINDDRCGKCGLFASYIATVHQQKSA